MHNLHENTSWNTTSVSMSVTYSDIKSGSSRSFGGFALQLTMGAAIGFMICGIWDYKAIMQN